MFTLYELKQNMNFRQCYKMPGFVKNMFLTLILLVGLLIVYLFYFRSDGGSY